eukprot:6608402-Prymnesium_polylepis.1
MKRTKPPSRVAAARRPTPSGGAHALERRNPKTVPSRSPSASPRHRTIRHKRKPYLLGTPRTKTIR